MKCHYEELGVARDANDSDIKTAYRKLALRWHPDKNPDNLVEAKERFQLIQQAYDVLSDAQERAWYDNHREQILRGKNSDYEENCLDLFQYFTVSCFKGYGDDDKGFYAVYRDVFENLITEDAEFMDDEDEVADIPSFGNSQSSYDDVVGPFYAYWQAYCTKKTYTWLYPYDIKDIKDRRILREIEKEFKKIAQKAKKERNEEVRNLVSFIRKRDKRVQAYKLQLEERAALNRQKQEQNRLDQIRKRQRELEEMHQKPNQYISENYEEELKQLESQYNDDTDDEANETRELSASDSLLEAEAYYMDNLYCVACNKSFKNEKAFLNHESSKKHRENVEILKQQMLEDEDAFKSSDEECIESDDIADEDIENIKSDIDELSIHDEDEKRKQKKNNKRNKKQKKTNLTDLASDHEDESIAIAIDKDLQIEVDTKLSNGASKKNNRKQKNKKQNSTSTINADTQTAEELQHEPVSSTKLNTADLTEQSATHVCATCNSHFESKNKLFTHLKKMNHGVYIPKKDTADSNHKKAKGKRK